MSETELAQFKRQIAPMVGFDLESYKPHQLERRIMNMMVRQGAGSLPEFYAMLKRDPECLRFFIDGLTINVSEFFRNPEKFEELRTEILPTLFGRFPRLRIWSAGCSIGAEIYSVAILLSQIGKLSQAELIATDIDDGILAQAGEGLYKPHELKSVPPEVLDEYFNPSGPGHRIREDLRRRVVFRKQNLLADPAVPGCHLILCRNVVIYFNEASKDRLYREFVKALVPGGVLFVGGTERIFNHQSLGFSQQRPFFYVKN